jgi:hypothetical protein
MADRIPKPGKPNAGEPPAPAASDNPFSGLSGFATLNEQSMRSMSDAGMQWLKAVDALQREIVDFAARRASEGAAHAEALLRCRNAQDVVFRQTEHVRHMMEDYLVEVHKLLSVWLEASTAKKPSNKNGS